MLVGRLFSLVLFQVTRFFFWGGVQYDIVVYFGFGPVKCQKKLFVHLYEGLFFLAFTCDCHRGTTGLGYNYITLLNAYYKDLQRWRWRRNKLSVSNPRCFRGVIKSSFFSGIMIKQCNYYMVIVRESLLKKWCIVWVGNIMTYPCFKA